MYDVLQNGLVHFSTGWWDDVIEMLVLLLRNILLIYTSEVITVK
jgi:hypothetical protein